MNPIRTGYHVLVVEDNPGDFILVEDLLLEQLISPVIVQAATFKQAKEILLANSQQFSVVLLDLTLPDHAGEALIREMVAICGNVPIIVLTGYINFNFGVRSLSMDIADYLVKDELTAVSLYKSIVYSTERKRIASALIESEKRVRKYANQLSNVLEEERSRIAREIHDEFGQQLSGLKMSLASLKKLAGNESNIHSPVDALIADLDLSIASLRQIANDLRPVVLDKLGLLAAIQWLLTEFEKKTSIRSTLKTDTEQLFVEKTIGTTVFRICQEALTNIAKHAEATIVRIEITHADEQMNLTITDNGRGIALGEAHSPLSMGLLNMEERAQQIGAELAISTTPGKGTIIDLKLHTHGKENTDS